MSPDHFPYRSALLQRIAELTINPSLVPLIDHYLDQLLAAGDKQRGRW